MDKSVVKLGLIGCGWISRLRLKQIAGDDAIEVAMLSDPDPAALNEAQLLAPNARITSAPDDATLSQLDAVMISSPNALHFEQAREVIARGLPVFVQKPIATRSQEVAQLLQLAELRNLPFDSDFCYRNLASQRAIIAAARRGDIGHIWRIDACFHNAWRPGNGWSADRSLAGGGALMDLGIHLMDTTLCLLRTPLSLRSCRLRSASILCRPDDVEDYASLDLTTDDDTEVRLTVAWDASTGRGAEIMLRAWGEDGTLELTNTGGSFFDFDAWHYQGTNSTHLASDRGDAWQAIGLLSWLHRVREGAGFREHLWAIHEMELIEAAYRGAFAETTPGEAVAAS